MPRRDQVIFSLASAITLVLFGLALGLWGTGTANYSVYPSALNLASVSADTQAIMAQFPDRPVGSPANAALSDWVATRFEVMGLLTQTLGFSVTVGSELRAGQLLWATVPGQRADVILISANRDTAFGRDNAAGVALLLELARIASAMPTPPEYTLYFVASDSREYGPAWGAMQFTRRFTPRNSSIVAALELTALNESHNTIAINVVGFQNGTAPVWLRQVSRAAVENAGATPTGTEALSEYFARAFPYTISEAAMYQRVGLPAVEFSGSPESVGPAAEQWLWLINTASIAPIQTRVLGIEQAYLPDEFVGLANLLLFMPLFIITMLALNAVRPSLRALQPELTALVAWFIVFGNAFAAAFILVNLSILPRYEIFPASIGDPFLTDPPLLAMLFVVGTLLGFGYMILGQRGSWGRLPDRLQLPPPVRRITLVLVFVMMVLGLWTINSYTTAVLLAPAAYFWPWIEPRPRPVGKILNMILALGGAFPWLSVVVALNLTPGYGPSWWFITLGAAYGLFPLGLTLGGLGALAVLARFIQLGLRETASR